MEIIVQVEKEVEIKTLEVNASVRYWEDSTVNGVEDTEGALIPARQGEMWCPQINIDTGQILNWKKGVIADIHYKVCDAGIYRLLDEDGKTILEKDGYVPDIMCPKDQGYGDYIIMDVNEDGMIQNWDNSDVSDFYN